MDSSSAAPAAAPSWHFSLKHLLLLLAVACIALAPSHYFGGVYLVSIGFSLTLAASCVAAYRSSAAGALFAAVAGLVMGFLLVFGLVVFAVHAFFNLCASVVLSAARVRPRT